METTHEKIQDALDANTTTSIKAISKAIAVGGETDYDAKVIITKEIVDRDGEIIKISGINFDNFLNNPVVLDSHKMNNSVLDILGKVVQLEDNIDDKGVAYKSALVKFADHPAAQYAKKMVQQGMLNTTSIGFAVNDYDYNTKTVTKAEMYELSFVAVPANPAATVLHAVKSLDMSDDEKQNIFKKLTLVEDIKPKIKEYRRLFLKGEIAKHLGYTITGNELVDIINIHDLILDKVKAVDTEVDKEETPTTPVTEETPTVEGPTEVDTVKAIQSILATYLEK